MANQITTDNIKSFSQLNLLQAAQISDGTKIITLQNADASDPDKVMTVGDLKNFISNHINNLVVNGSAEFKGTFNIIKPPKYNGFEFLFHNIPRNTPKDITAYYNDGTLWKRLAGTNGFGLYEDIFAGDYFKMSRPISAYERTGEYQVTGSQYVTIAGISTLKGNGDSYTVGYEHLVMVPGQGFGGTQHFGRSRMNPTNTTAGGYKGSEMNTATIGAVATAGSTGAQATINQQLFAEFGSHLKTMWELVSNSINASGSNRIGEASGCSNSAEWGSFQAILMSEVECYGSTVWSSSGYDTGCANHQLPLFFFSNNARNNRSAYYWLKDVASSAYFCAAYRNGASGYGTASYASTYVRPRFVIA